MQNNYYFLRKLSKALAQKFNTSFFEGFEESNFNVNQVSSFKIGTCFSQSKDELIIGFYNANQEIYLRAALFSDFSCLSLMEDFHRAKRNSVELFEEILDKKLIAITQFKNERSFVLHLEADFHLLFKMHGRRSNVLLFDRSNFIRGFHKKMENDKTLAWKNLDRKLDISWERFESLEGNFTKFLPTLGKEAKKYILTQAYENKSLEEKWDFFQKFIKNLENTEKYYIIQEKQLPELWLFPTENEENILFESSQVLEVLNELFFRYVRNKALFSEKNLVFRQLQKQVKKTENYINKNFTRLSEILDSSRNEEIANILMANLHQIPERIKEITLFDFYNEKDIKIKLKDSFSPQKNAEVYYRKAKNEKIEKEKLEQNITLKENELKTLKQHLQILDKIENIKELRKYLKENNLNQQNKKQEKMLPELFRTFQYQGFEILVGKNAKNNDMLTQHYAKKEDLWLHAKDVSGSHVIIKHQSGKKFPSDVIEKAASLAAFYSKRSQDTLCPVIYTSKKFVRKTKDLLSGQVIVEKENILMVIPEKF